MTPKAYLVTGAARGIGATIEVLMSAIADIKATTVAVPLEAPQRHANGTHWGRFVRTIIEVIDTEGGRSGWSEMGGGG